MKEESEGELFGRLVAKKIDSFTGYNKALAINRINNFFMEIEFGANHLAVESGGPIFQSIIPPCVPQSSDLFNQDMNDM